MDNLPYLGAGVSYRPKWRREVLSRPEWLGCLEIITDHYLDCPREKLDELEALAAAYRLLPHGLSLSFGTDAPLDEALLRKTAALVERIRPPWFTEHLAFTGAQGMSVGHLAPLPFTREAVDAVCRNVRRWNGVVGLPLLLENITYGVQLPGEMTEAEFLTDVVERSGCGLLLDLHNVHTNAVNFGFEAEEFIAALPLAVVKEIHLGGGHNEADGYRVDSHSSATPEAVWELLRYVARRSDLHAVVVEWDVQLPPFGEILAEVRRAHEVLELHAPPGSSGRDGAALHR